MVNELDSTAVLKYFEGLNDADRGLVVDGTLAVDCKFKVVSQDHIKEILGVCSGLNLEASFRATDSMLAGKKLKTTGRIKPSEARKFDR